MVSTLELDIEFRGNLSRLTQQIELDRKSKDEREKLLRKMLNEKVEMEKYLQEHRQKNK